MKIEFEEREYYGHIIKSDGGYTNLLKDNFNFILKDDKTKTLENFKNIYDTKEKFYQKIAEYTKTNYTYANEIHISLLNLYLDRCKINDNYKLKIQVFTDDNFHDKTENYIITIINKKYSENIIIIPVYKLKAEHYQSIHLS